jgi:hypothetical protein
MSNDATSARSPQLLERLRQRQVPRVPGWHRKPFLTDPPEFGSRRSRQEVDQSQDGQIVAIPDPKHTPPVMDIAEVVGDQHVQEVEQSGQIVFQSVGDTGSGQHWDLGEVVEVMTMDYHRSNPADHPAFFLHLGDVTYNYKFGEVESKRGMYLPQFYTPYDEYPGKILAIPGNHDSNPEEDPDSIGVFQENFCADPPASAAALNQLLQSPKRSPMYQPAVYFRLNAPFVEILALFSNGGEHEGVIRGGVAGNAQWTFLVDQLKQIKAERGNGGPRKALVLAVHHPPYSGGGGHSGSTQMLNDLDAAFKEGGVAPDAILSGHAHNYQRYTRAVPHGARKMQVPYVVAGNGGHNITPMKPGPDRKPVQPPLFGERISNQGRGGSDHSLRNYFNGYGHLLVTVTNRVLTIDLIGTKTESETPVDSVTVALAPDFTQNRIVHETPPFGHPANGERETKHVTHA